MWGVPLRSDPLDELKIPDGTTAEEHDLVTEGDVIIGGQSTVEFGVRGHNVIGGERVRFGGDIEAEGDCRLDMWCDVAGNVLVGADAYLGERVHVGGQLMVSGNLDIGDDVDIEEGFEANGWIVIRNPMPTIVFLFVYLSQLLRIGEEEAAEEMLSGLLDEDHEHDPLLLPRGSRVNDDAWRVSTPATVGDDCRLHGNIRAKSLDIGVDTEVFGSLRAREDIRIGERTEVHGDVTTREGLVYVDRDAHVWGDISADDVMLHDDATIEGSIRARGEMTVFHDEDDDAPDVDDAGESTEPSSDDQENDETTAPASATDDRDEDERATATTDDERATATTDDERATATTDDDQASDETTVDGDADSDDDTDGTGKRVTADGQDPDDAEHRENGHDPAELAE
ncbi:polymer-forming cytoskeletal protein [Halorientalis marina]|uniref:polymer-forming cytoskeletal protein n=1 Tax=Halorientalis marina TaxID=2931976 RepID=UPI001FF5E445|nr:polymer-forming cytoskeletal protein [Halorientalis marina]